MIKFLSKLQTMNGFQVTKLFTGYTLPIVVILFGVIVAIVLMQTSPKAERRPHPKQARLVEVEEVHFTSERITIYAMGTVIPARQIDIKPRVNGQIIDVSKEFIPGGRFKAGQMLLRIDPSDYQLIIKNRKSDVIQARSKLELEMGQQAVSQREYELLGESITDEDRELVLRKPQLASAEADLERAQAALAQARLDLERTVVIAPFNALVKSRAVDLGVQVTPATTLASLCETDRYWIRLAVPVDKLRWISIPDSTSAQGSVVRVYDETAWGEGKFRSGHVIRMTGNLEERGRMAELLVEITDPMAQLADNSGQPAMILDSYVRVEIEGIELDSVAAIERRLIRSNNSVWIMDANNQLEIRDVQIAYFGSNKVFVVGGIQQGERLITTDLSAPVAGMPLRTSKRKDDTVPLVSNKTSS